MQNLSIFFLLQATLDLEISHFGSLILRLPGMMFAVHIVQNRVCETHFFDFHSELEIAKGMTRAEMIPLQNHKHLESQITTNDMPRAEMVNPQTQTTRKTNLSEKLMFI